MRKRLSKVQKHFAVCVILLNAEVPLSVSAIGKKIGFKTGEPIKQTVNEMFTSGVIASYGRNNPAEDWIGYFMEAKQRRAIRKELGIEK